VEAPTNRVDFVDRRAARVLVVDAAWRVLLLRGHDPASAGRQYWLTVGGGLRTDETTLDAGVRELYEEIGLRITPDALGEPVFSEIADFSFDGVWYRQQQEYFLLRVESLAVDFAGHDDAERASIDAYRWWSVHELHTTDERLYPRALPELMARLKAAPA
jgi:8-oxo-dGTP pyrophosphatase MutT (NUDIX family)